MRSELTGDHSNLHFGGTKHVSMQLVVLDDRDFFAGQCRSAAGKRHGQQSAVMQPD